jgi:hypothetical protein
MSSLKLEQPHEQPGVQEGQKQQEGQEQQEQQEQESVSATIAETAESKQEERNVDEKKVDASIQLKVKSPNGM